MTLVLVLSLFGLGMLGFAVDMTNFWFHRQAAHAAADAACEAGALDMLAGASGMSTTGSNFTTGTAGNCASTSSATMCKYASFNGYNGTGLLSTAESNSVSWTFPSSVPGVTATGTNPFLQVSISEHVRSYFMSLLTRSNFQTLNTSCTCGVIQVKEAAPMVVLHPTLTGSFYYSGGGALDIVGGPQRGVQVNSSSSTAIQWLASGMIDLSKGGPNGTGSDVAIVGGPSAIPTNGTSTGYSGGTTGAWKTGVIAVADPYGSVGIPASVKSLTPVDGTSGIWVAYGVDGCPDTVSTRVYVGQDPKTYKAYPANCNEFSPGYYPNGIALNGVSTIIFQPGVYYLNGSLTAGGSNILRMAKPSGYQQTDGVMFYFLTGSLNFSGCTGCSESGVDNANTSDLTCNASSPPSSLGMAATIGGNVLWGQCATNATYFDSGGDTTDSRSATGGRGILVFQDPCDTTQPSFTGSGQLTFSGSLYFHNAPKGTADANRSPTPSNCTDATGYKDLLSLNGGSSSGTYVLGEIITDQVELTGSGMIKLALNPVPTTNMSKVAILQ